MRFAGLGEIQREAMANASWIAAEASPSQGLRSLVFCNREFKKIGHVEGSEEEPDQRRHVLPPLIVHYARLFET